MTTTFKDLHVTAFNAAASTLTQDALSAEQGKINAFLSAGYDHADFSTFEAIHTKYLADLKNYANTPTPAAKAALAAAQQAAAVTAPATTAK